MHHTIHSRQPYDMLMSYTLQPKHAQQWLQSDGLHHCLHRCVAAATRTYPFNGVTYTGK